MWPRNGLVAFLGYTSYFAQRALEIATSFSEKCVKKIDGWRNADNTQKQILADSRINVRLIIVTCLVWKIECICQVKVIHIDKQGKTLL